MSGALLLAGAWSRQHRARLLLVSAAVALATSLVVFTVSSYRATLQRSVGFAADMLGPFELVLMPRIAMQPEIPEALTTGLAADPAVRSLVRTRVIHADIEDVANTTYYESWHTPFIATVDGRASIDLAEGEWPVDRAESATQPDPIDGVVSGGLAKRWRVAVGDRLPVQAPSGLQELVIVGLTAEVLAHGKASGVFVTPRSLDRLAGGTRTEDRIFVDLQDGVDAAALAARWSESLAMASPPLLVHDVASIASGLGADKAVSSLRSLGAGASILVLIAAIFIVATAIAAGAGERRRQLALLRTIGATRGQIHRAVLGESLLLAGLGCAVGVPLGWVWLQLLGLVRSQIFGGLILPDGLGLLAGVVVTALAVVIAGLGPALAAGRVAPVEAMGLATGSQSRGSVLLRGSLALLSAGLGLVLVAVTADADPALLAMGTVLGLLLLAVAALLVVPAMIRLVETVCGPLVARCLAVPHDLLRHQQGPHLARAGGLVLTVAVCLGASITLNIWGRTMVAPFLPAPELPDQVISLLPGGVPPEQAQVVAGLSGLDPQRVLPLVVEQTAVGGDLLIQSGGDPDAIYVQVIGVDPAALAAEGERPLLPMDLVPGAGAPTETLCEPGTCLVPPAFAQRFGLAVGDHFALTRCGTMGEEVTLRIVGLASLPGWQWITKMGRMRSLGGKPMAALVMSDATARSLGIPTVRHWLADTVPGFDHAALRGELQELADSHAGTYVGAHFGAGKAQRPSVKMIATGEVARRMRERSAAVIWLLGAIPLATLLVAVLGVANAVTAGIRARRWEFGVLRAIGLERGQALRLLLAENLLVLLAAGLLSLLGGIAAAWMGIALSLQAFGAGTGRPELVIPWLDVALAWSFTTVCCLLAAALPVRALLRTSPLALLQGGRAAM